MINHVYAHVYVYIYIHTYVTYIYVYIIHMYSYYIVLYLYIATSLSWLDPASTNTPILVNGAACISASAIARRRFLRLAVVAHGGESFS